MQHKTSEFSYSSTSFTFVVAEEVILYVVTIFWTTEKSNKSSYCHTPSFLRLSSTFNKGVPMSCTTKVQCRYIIVIILVSCFSLLRPGLFSKKFHPKLSRRILRHMHGVLNIDEKTNCTVWLEIARRMFYD